MKLICMTGGFKKWRGTFACTSRFLIVLSGYAQGASAIWTNTAGGNWNVAANWNPNTVPTPNDAAIIDTHGTRTVFVISSVMINTLLMGGSNGIQTLSNSVNNLNITGAGNIIFNGVLIHGAGGCRSAAHFAPCRAGPTIPGAGAACGQPGQGDIQAYKPNERV